MQKHASVPVRRRRQPAVPRVSLRKRLKTILCVGALALFSVLTIGLIYLLSVFIQVSRTLPSISDIANYQPGDHTTLFYADNDKNGKPKILAVLATENRQPVKLEDINQHLLDATIAVEDSRFYEHSGVDYHGIVRALWRNVSSGDIRSQGASTITQQLARNISSLGLTREKRIRRKVAEAVLAVRIEQTFTKNEILELYLNQVFYGNGAYGVQAASKAYFNKDAKHLSLAEAATLAGMPQRPSVYSVDRNAARDRRNAVLSRMETTGKISHEDAIDAMAQPVVLRRAELKGNQINGAPYFVNHVVGQLIHTYGSEAVYSGWRIYTTLHSGIQERAEECLQRGVAGGTANQGCLISLEPKTGFIRAMVGGVDYHRDQYNAVTQGKRQPGSAFKPIVYTAAIDSGVCTLDSTYRDDRNFPWRHSSDKWLPKNYDGRCSYSRVTVLSALKRSLNTVAVKVAMDVGLRNVISYAHRMGITTDLDPYPPLALGASAVRPIELCSAYSVFANDGKRARPVSILRIVAPNDEVIEENVPEVEDTHLRPETVQAMNSALQEVILHGTGTEAAAVPNAHGKTGTTSDNIDAWFCGYTPELATVVWVAHEQRNHAGAVVKYLHMPGATGGHLCAPIWREFMLKAVPMDVALARASVAPTVKEVPSDTPKGEPGHKRGTQDESDQPDNGNATSPDSIDSPDGQGTGGSGGDEPAGSAPAAGASANLQGPVSSRGSFSHTDTMARASEPSGRPSTQAANRGDEVISVTLCADTMRRATRWCPSTVERRMARRDVPGLCRAHRAPPGE